MLSVLDPAVRIGNIVSELPEMGWFMDNRIVSTPGVCTGKPRIAGRRITVEDIAVWHDRLGRSADDIAAEYDLDLADIYGALAYYFTHKAEIDQKIAEGEAFVELLRKKKHSSEDQ